MNNEQQPENEKLEDPKINKENQTQNKDDRDIQNDDKLNSSQTLNKPQDKPINQLIKGDFEPKVIAFLCNWGAYAGADLCGISRYQYPTNIRAIRVMCSTRVDPAIIIEMFVQGADGVLVGGCHLGNCHHISGNYQTERKIKLTKKLLEEAGLEFNRLRLEWISASEGERFANVMTEFTNELKELGPSPLAGENPDIDKLEALFAARNVAKDFRLRALVGREIELTEEGNVYNEKLAQEKLDGLYETIVRDEFLRHRILQLTKNRPLSVKDISKYVNYTPLVILKQIVSLKDRGLISVDRIDGTSPLYISGMVEVEEMEIGLEGGE